MKRFWKSVAIDPVEGGFSIRLDHRPVRTPAKAPCVVPGRALAEAMAAEWDTQGENVNPTAMPVTKAANSTIDRVIPEAEAVAAAIAAYGETDLICYRAAHPIELAARQSAAWDPLIDWAEKVLDARLNLAEGIIHVAQPGDSVAQLGAAVRAHSPWELTGLHDLVTISGSLVLGLAVSHGRLDAEAAWPLSRIDEDWNIEEWGADDEAEAVANRRRADFMNAARLLELVRA